MRILLAFLALTTTPLAAQTTFSTTDLDSNHDGKVGLTKPRDSFKAKDVLVRCPDLPTYTYAKKCPERPVMPAIQGANKNGVLKLAALPGPVRITGAFRAIETYTTTTASGVVIDGLTADDLQRGGVRLRGKLSNITIRNSSFTFRRTPQSSPNLPACLEIGDKSGSRVDGVLLQNVTCDGFQMTMAANRYWNGDGPTFERNVTGLRLDNVTSKNSTDSCFDIKVPVTATRIEAEGCARNYRFWSSADVQQLTSGTPNKRGGTSGTTHIWIHGSNTAPPTIRIRKLIVRSTNTTNIFTIEDGAATVILDSCDVKVPAGTKFKVGGSKGIVMKLGAGCQA